ncbi:maltokinase N-terminal cap-like domain-containing protein [Streptomyces sp. 142MFCol3.1]|uniref:maltokinase N-terminal cap-like domain-containing protein n=1 Tax=Streptomyces sp. 142MFCol3.1 TaxID=1172179 RepID=UPI000412D3EE|nr:phosphotransferase [Streptomyces sp. 142MFCol3.1]
MTVAVAEPVLQPLLPALTPWLRTRRWFGAGGGALDSVRPVVVSVVHDEAPVLVHAVLGVPRPDGAEQLYQLFLGLCPALPPRLAGAAIATVPEGRWQGWTLYEATEDAALMGVLLRSLAVRGRRDGPRLERTFAHPLPVGLVPRLLSADQSNSAVVYGDRLLFKIYRRPEPGPHLEVEALRALTERHCARTPALHGTLYTDAPGGEGLVLGMFEEFLPVEADGWQTALHQVGDCLEGRDSAAPATGGFTAHARALGEAVAEVHAVLADAFPRTRVTPEEVAEEARLMKLRLRLAADEVPALDRYRGRIGALYDDYARHAGRGCPVFAQRVHGDLHLGQVLPTADGWRLIDFEGEPDRSAAERAEPQPVLRDVAGMLRSFDYAARTGLAAVRKRSADRTPGIRLRHARRAEAWAIRNRRAFIAGYAGAGGADPRCHPVPLRAFEADKAVYEAVYEARHRPDWLGIPLTAVHRLAGVRG